MFTIQVRWPNGSITEFVVKKDTVSLGRAPESDVFLPSELASRNHAIIYLAQGGKVYIEDLQSSNGTFIKNAAIKVPTEITPDIPVKLGDVYLRVKYEEPEALPKFAGATESEYTIAQRLGDRKRTVAIAGDKGAELRRMFQEEERKHRTPAPEAPKKR